MKNLFPILGTAGVFSLFARDSLGPSIILRRRPSKSRFLRASEGGVRVQPGPLLLSGGVDRLSVYPSKQVTSSYPSLPAHAALKPLSAAQIGACPPSRYSLAASTIRVVNSLESAANGLHCRDRLCYNVRHKFRGGTHRIRMKCWLMKELL